MILIHPFWETCPTSSTGASATIGTISGNNAFIPHYGLYNYNWSAWILTAAEIGGPKQITGIGYTPVSYTSGFQYLNQVIKVGHVVESSWPTATPQINLSDITVTDLKIVKTYFTETPVSGIVNRFNFDSYFCYDGTSNLLIVWENRDTDWTGGYGTHQHTVATNQGAYQNLDANFPTGSGIRINTKPVTKLYT